MSNPIQTTVYPSEQQRATNNPENRPVTASSWRNALVEVFAGGAGGAGGAFAIAPFMYLKMYLQERAMNNPETRPVLQKNPVKWFVGSPTMAAGMFPVTAFQFAVNGYLRKKLSQEGERELSAGEKLACSVTSGALSAVFVGPQELIWTQQQKAQADLDKVMKEQNVPKEKMPKVSARDVCAKIYREHGFKGFYRGAMETAGREAVSASVLTNLAGQYPFLSPMVGAALSQPLDGRKTSKQVNFSYKASWKEMCMPKAFAGLGARIPMYWVFMNVAPVVKDKVAKVFDQ